MMISILILNFRWNLGLVEIVMVMTALVSNQQMISPNAIIASMRLLLTHQQQTMVKFSFNGFL